MMRDSLKPMRTTIALDPDVEAAVEQLRRQHGLGLSEAVNSLARRGIVERPRPKRFKQRTFNMGAMIDVTNIGEVLDLLDDE